jgi:intron-binding protein aquarius
MLPSTDWVELAEKNWTKQTQKTRKVRLDVVKQEIWDVLEKEGFDFRSLVALDNLQLLEKWVYLALAKASTKQFT